MLECKPRFHGRGRCFTCSAQEYCASGAKSLHTPEAGLLGEAPGTRLEAGVTEGLAAGVGLVGGLVPGGQRLQVAAQ